MTPEPPIDFDFDEGQPKVPLPGGDGDATHDGGVPPAPAPVRSLPPLVRPAPARSDRTSTRHPERKGIGSTATRARQPMLLRGICAAIAAVLVSALIVLGLRAVDRAIRGSAAAPRNDAFAIHACMRGTLAS